MEKIDNVGSTLEDLDILIHKIHVVKYMKIKHDKKVEELEKEKARIINTNGFTA